MIKSVLPFDWRDGFNAKHFYRISAFKVLVCDFDKRVIETVQKKNKRSNIVFKIGNIRKGILSGYTIVEKRAPELNIWIKE